MSYITHIYINSILLLYVLLTLFLDIIITKRDLRIEIEIKN